MKSQGGKILVLLILLSGFFCCQKRIRADSGQVAINEIAWMGGAISANDEWMELRNSSNENIDIEGWKLVALDGSPEINLSGIILAGGYFLLERTDDESAPNFSADLIYAGALGNDGEVLELRDADGNLIDAVDASGGWPAGDNVSKQTMEKGNGGIWQTSETAGGTPKEINSSPQSFPAEEEGGCGDGFLDEGEECDDGNLIGGDGCGGDCMSEDEDGDDGDSSSDSEQNEDSEPVAILKFKLGDVVINEFVSDPADDEVEWIELYNKTGKEINLSGWSLEEGSGAKTILEGVTNNFFILEKPKGNLNNAGDIIILRDDSGNLIDQVSYGAWDDGDIGNNAPVANDPYSAARIIDGYNTFNNLNDFKITKKTTKNVGNIIEEDKKDSEELSAEEMSAYDYSNNILISEILPNPYGVDNDEEFIELYNSGDKEVDLTGWMFGDATSRKYKIESTKNNKNTNAIIKPNDYFVIYRSDSKVALNNTGDTVKLYQPLKDEPFIEMKYSDAIEGWSYVNTSIKTDINTNLMNNDWVWTELITPGEENIIKTVNHPPIIDFYCPKEYIVNSPIVFDSSDTVDPDNDELSFLWDFGDGFTSKFVSPEHTFTGAGNYVVKAVVSDGENEVEKEKIIKIMSQSDLLSDKRERENNEPNLSRSALAEEGEVCINEILPNPEGADADGEFIELKNNSFEKINLLNWQLDDAEGGSRPYIINSDTWIDVEDYLLIHRAESGLALNNTLDSVRLFNSFGELIDSVDYSDVIEGEAYARGANAKWFWTDIITPEIENIISTSDKRIQKTGLNNEINSKNEVENTYIQTDLEKIRDLESGDLIKTKGTVAVLPGVLGAQYFYIIGSPGIQVYNYKKDFPDLAVGDYVEVSGEISIINGEKRLKTKSKDDIVKIASQKEPVPTHYECEKICEDNIGELVAVSGEIVERKSSIIWLDDGTDEVEVYIKNYTGINPKDYSEGEQVEIAGIVGMAKSGPRIMPRNQRDIIKKDIESQDVGRVLGEVAVSDKWEIAKRDKKIELFKYLLVIAVGMIAVLGGLLIREVKK